MIEKMRHISNPLTIIAIFAALAEIAGTIVLGLVIPELQRSFMWFVMLFPTGLVLLFFLTLNFNPRVLYAPSDFQNEENFLQILAGRQRISVELADVVTQLEESKKRIVEEAQNELGQKGSAERQRLDATVEQQLGLIRSRLDATRATVEDLADDVLPTYLTRSGLQARILKHMINERGTGIHHVSNVAKAVGMSGSATQRALDRMVQGGLIETFKDSYGLQKFRLPNRRESSTNNTPDGICQPADGLPKPSV